MSKRQRRHSACSQLTRTRSIMGMVIFKLHQEVDESRKPSKDQPNEDDAEQQPEQCLQLRAVLPLVSYTSIAGQGALVLHNLLLEITLLLRLGEGLVRCRRGWNRGWRCCWRCLLSCGGSGSNWRGHLVCCCVAGMKRVVADAGGRRVSECL
jgi:hypothetical protein